MQNQRTIKHCTCGKALDYRNVVGLCRSCYFRADAANPERIAVRKAARRRNLDCPERGQRLRAQLIAAGRKRLEWCPLEYQDWYRRLLKIEHFRAAEARAMIEQQIAADVARYARTGELQQSRRAA